MEREGSPIDPNRNEIKSEHNEEFHKGKKVLGVEFAPLNIPLNRRMETLAVLSFICTFFLMGPGGWVLFLYLFFFTRFGFISLLYLAWYLYDKDTCKRGGRKWDWVRNWPLWKHYVNYFPIKLVKTAELDPKNNYLFGCHPHGIICNGAFGNFATEGTYVSKVFPGIATHLLTLEGHYSMPLYREYLMCAGTVSADRESLNYILNYPGGGHAACLAVGGAPESLDSHPGSYVLQLKKRKGFIKYALKSGASLVPVFSFGETDIYDQVNNPEGSLLRRCQNKMQQMFGLAPVFFLGRGIFQYSFGLLPQRRPITTVVGAPIHLEKVLNPTQEEIETVHQTYIKAVESLFETHRKKYADPNAELKIF